MAYLATIKKEARAILPNQFAAFADNNKLFKKSVVFFIHNIRRVETKTNGNMWFLHIQTTTLGKYMKDDASQEESSDDYTISFGALEYRDLVLIGLATAMDIDLDESNTDDVLEPYGPCQLEKAGRMFDIIDVEPTFPGGLSDPDGQTPLAKRKMIKDDLSELDDHPF